MKERSAVFSWLLAAAVSISGCTADANAPSGRADAKDTTATELCKRAIAPTDSVLAAALTTVDQVRKREGGPPPGNSPAARPWAQLPADEPAAWCTIKSGSSYAVAAAGPDGSLVRFMVSNEPLSGAYPEGPAIP